MRQAEATLWPALATVPSALPPTAASGNPTFMNDDYQLSQKDYTPISSGTIQGGYCPTISQGLSSAPASVPKQPSSVQPPKK